MAVSIPGEGDLSLWPLTQWLGLCEGLECTGEPPRRAGGPQKIAVANGLQAAIMCGSILGALPGSCLYDGRSSGQSERRVGFGIADPGGRGRPRSRASRQGAMSPGTGCSAPRVLAADLQRCGRVAVAATLGVQAPVAAFLVQQLLQSSAARGDHGGRDSSAAVRGAGTALSVGVPLQVSISGAV